MNGYGAGYPLNMNGPSRARAVQSIPSAMEQAAATWKGRDERADYWAAVNAAARRLGATRAEFGLWTLPGYPELTSGQLLDIASRAQ